MIPRTLALPKPKGGSKFLLIRLDIRDLHDTHGLRQNTVRIKMEYENILSLALAAVYHARGHQANRPPFVRDTLTPHYVGAARARLKGKRGKGARALPNLFASLCIHQHLAQGQL